MGLVIGVRVRHGRIDVVGHSDREYEKEIGVRVRHGSIDVVGHWRGHGRNRRDNGSGVHADCDGVDNAKKRLTTLIVGSAFVSLQGE